ncbi:RecQ mediated genome instability protein 1, N-terminal [Dillenia turbinata]|uniref:RecQ mediated genome instability protein 1, N-terminal n=1 Tax=Dillenia turbinata TaxID=194707 RepID=A0AAN8ZPL7_9MAGN
MEDSSSSFSSPSEALLEALKERGWSFKDTEQVKALIQINAALHDYPSDPNPNSSSSLINSIESDLANEDLRSIGAKSLPDPSLLRKSSLLLGPKVLQVSSVRDISRSSIESESKGSKRLLRLGLTDGHSDVIAIEYSYIPSLSDDIVPGIKIRLENKVKVCGGIVCLNPKVVTVLGGVVESLYEEWQLNQKYSGLSCSSIRRSQEGEGSGPPPFEKLQIGMPAHKYAQEGSGSNLSCSTSKNPGNYHVKRGESSCREQIGDHQITDSSTNGKEDNRKTVSDNERAEGKPSSSEARTRQVAEAAPVQNQAASQKLLQKMSNPNLPGWQNRGSRRRGKGTQEEREFLTLDEWERRNARGSLARDKIPDLTQDEELAWQLQHELDLEDHFPRHPHEVDAENLKMSMFNYERDDGRTGSTSRGRGGKRGRGRGRGSGSGRGRGRGR